MKLCSSTIVKNSSHAKPHPIPLHPRHRSRHLAWPIFSESRCGCSQKNRTRNLAPIYNKLTPQSSYNSGPGHGIWRLSLLDLCHAPLSAQLCLSVYGAQYYHRFSALECYLQRTNPPYLLVRIFSDSKRRRCALFCPSVKY